MSTNQDQKNVLVLLVVAFLALGVVGAGVGLMFFRLRMEVEEVVEAPPNPVEAPMGESAMTVGLIAPLEKPKPPPGGYVGSDKCATCHATIAESYRTHPMSRSFATVAGAEAIETYDQTKIEPPGPRHYEVEQRDGQVFHREVMLDQNGEPIYDQQVEISHVLGSGQRGRSYLTVQNGKFFQSPLGWYSTNEKWDLSPGYGPDQHSRFARRLGVGCFYCHVGRTSETTDDDRFADPPFLELAIGCERCHGPGAEHVAFREKDAAAGELDPIVNPVRLDPPQREDVCNQCHLQGDAIIRRYGREHYDFRPGQRLEENWAIFVSDAGIKEGRTQAVSQVQQMRVSACFQGSGGKFGCTSCHDPHLSPAPEAKITFYRDRCLQCHGNGDDQRSCALPEPDRRAQSAEDSCIQCHMPPLPTQDVPHTAQTDHRVLRRPQNGLVAGSNDQSPTEYRLFDGAEERMPRREIERARGLAMLEQPVVLGDPELLQLAQVQLAPRLRFVHDRYDDSFLDTFGDDTPALFGLGRTFQQLGDVPRAEACWDAILRTDPKHEGALYWKIINAQTANQPQKALDLLNRLLALNPHDASVHGQKAFLLGQAGQWAAASAAAEQSILLDPSVLEIREFLALAYGNIGREDLRQKQLEAIRRMQEVMPKRE